MFKGRKVSSVAVITASHDYIFKGKDKDYKVVIQRDPPFLYVGVEQLREDGKFTKTYTFNTKSIKSFSIEFEDGEECDALPDDKQ